MSTVTESLPMLPKQEPGKTINGKRVRVPARVALGEVTPNNVGTLKKLNLVLFPINYSDKFYSSVLEPNVEPYSKLVFYQDLAVGNIVSRLEPISTTNDATTSKSSSSVATTTPERAHAKLYIMTLGVLSPYRRQGLATKLLSAVLQAAQESHLPPPPAPPPLVEDKPSASKKLRSGAAVVDKAQQEEEEEQAKKRKKKADAARAEWERQAKREIVDSVYVHVWMGNAEGKAFWEKHGFQVTGEMKDYYRKIEPRDAWVLEKKIEGK